MNTSACLKIGIQSWISFSFMSHLWISTNILKSLLAERDNADFIISNYFFFLRSYYSILKSALEIIYELSLLEFFLYKNIFVISLHFDTHHSLVTWRRKLVCIFNCLCYITNCLQILVGRKRLIYLFSSISVFL